MPRKVLIVMLYASLLFIGGLIGHLKAHSQASLIMGCISSLALYFAAWALWCKKSWSEPLTLLFTLMMVGFFSYRFVLTEKFMPPGLLACISLALAVYLFMTRKERSSL